MESGLHQLLCFQPASFCPCRDEMYDTASFQKTKRVHQNAPFYADTLRYQERKNVFSAHGWFRNCRYHFCYNFYGTSMKGYYRYYPNCSISQTFAFVYPFQSLFPLFLVCPSSIRRCSARREPVCGEAVEAVLRSKKPGGCRAFEWFRLVCYRQFFSRSMAAGLAVQARMAAGSNFA